MHSRNLKDCLQLLFRHVQGWLKSPSSTRARERDASCSWSEKASSEGSSWLGACHRHRPKVLLFSVSLRYLPAFDLLMAVLQRLFTLNPTLDVKGNPSASPSSHVPSEQPVAIVSHTPAMGSIPLSFRNDNNFPAVQWLPTSPVCCPYCVPWCRGTSAGLSAMAPS